MLRRGSPGRLPGRTALALILGSLASFGPVSIDLYLPALPELTGDFRVSTSTAQLTLTACLAGLALGQLLAGPVSDALGRRGPLLIGLAAYTAASAGCALAPSAAVLTGLRLVQGLAGAAGIVIARAVVRDLFSGVEMARFLSLLMLVNGAAPILAPSVGSQLMLVMSWPGLFWVLAGWGALLLLAVAVGLPETLPRGDRGAGGLAATPRVMAGLLSDRRFVGYTLACGLNFAAMFAYISGSTYVLQQSYRLNPQQFALVFAVNAVGIMGLGQLNRVLLRRWDARRLLGGGLGVALVGAVALVAATQAGAGLAVVLPALFLVVASVGMVAPNATALVLAGQPGQAGSASALLGVLQFLFGAVAAPLVGVLGTTTAAPMALLMGGLTVAAVVTFGVLAGRGGPAPEGVARPAAAQ